MSEQVYEIRVKGCLDSDWSDWFGGLRLMQDEDRGETILTGPVVDQTALYSLILKARNLSLTLVSVRVMSGPDTGSGRQRAEFEGV